MNNEKDLAAEDKLMTEDKPENLEPKIFNEQGTLDSLVPFVPKNSLTVAQQKKRLRAKQAKMARKKNRK